MHTPEQTVSAFIRAYRTWNERTNELATPSGPGNAIEQEALEAASADYDRLVDQFCAPSVLPQAISYGDESMHHPDREAIESVEVAGSEATVRTRHVGLHDFASDYEYRLVQVAGEWRIASPLYIGEDGAYECL